MKVMKISVKPEMEQAFAIRNKVFVEEQQVSPEEEYDEFEDSSIHFLAYNEQGKACGTARWRFTDNGIKLERFAVLKECRGMGVGSDLVERVLADIAENPRCSGKLIYLHAQLKAVPLYAKFDFIEVGDEFEECGIRHSKMIRKQKNNRCLLKERLFLF